MLLVPPPWPYAKIDISRHFSCYKKTRGYEVMWLPGMDHAGIATQAKVDAALRQKALTIKI